MSNSTHAPGWWQASDGNWYPPESHPDAALRLQPPSHVAAFAPPPSFRAPREDNGFVHLLRFLGVWLLMAMLFYVIVGYVWMMFALSATGRRKRDILMLLIPIWGTVVGIQTMWRYTAKNVYWSVRPDRVSKSLFSG